MTNSIFVIMRIDHRITAITETNPVTAADFRTYARAVNISGEDSLIERQLEASVRWVEQYINRSINENTFSAVIWDFDDDRDLDRGEIHYPLPFAPVKSITSVTGQDLDGNDTALTVDEDYFLLEGGRLRIPSATSYSTYKIVYVAGMESVEVTPNIKEAIYKLTAELYENRGISVTGTIVSNLKADINSLLSSERAKTWL